MGMKKTKLSFSIFDLYMRVICLFPIFTVLGNEGIINKILFGVLLLLHIGLMFRARVTKGSLYHILLMAFLLVFTLLQTTFPVVNINLLFYYPFFVLYMTLWNDNMERYTDWFRNHEQYIVRIIVIWTVIVGISALMPSSYYIKEAGASYFGSFCGDIFRLGPSCFFIQVLVLALMSFFNRKKAVFFMVLPMYSYLMGSSRAYLVIGTCLFVIAWYWFGVSKKVFLATIIPIGIVGVYLLMQSSMMEKILFTLDENQVGDFWFRITSSRNVIWSRILGEYAKMPIPAKLFGSGVEFTAKASRHWAHNDFIEILCSFGLLGVVQYCSVIAKSIRQEETVRKTVPMMVKCMIFIAWLFNAFFNMHYTYFCCMLSLPLAILTVRNYYTPNHDKDSK